MGKESDADVVEGLRGLFEGLSATWFRGMTYALARFWAYDVSKAELNKRKCNLLTMKRNLKVITFHRIRRVSYAERRCLGDGRRRSRRLYFESRR
jgi:Mitochondrial carrier protein